MNIAVPALDHYLHRSAMNNDRNKRKTKQAQTNKNIYIYIYIYTMNIYKYTERYIYRAFFLAAHFAS